MAGSLSRPALGSRYLPAAMVHIAAGGLGGALGIWVIRLTLGDLLEQVDATVVAIALGTILVMAVFRDLNVLRFPVPSTNVQVPKDWRRELPIPVWAFGYGLLLGMTILTKVTSATVLAALLATALGISDLSYALFMGALYGATRCAIIFRKRFSWSQPSPVATVVGGLFIALAVVVPPLG